MTDVTVIDHKGTSVTLQLPTGSNLMRGMLSQGIRGVYAECGGEQMCATCHVYLESPDQGFAEVSEDEDEMLEATACDRLANSRLSCCLVVTSDDEPITVRLPEMQR